MSTIAVLLVTVLFAVIGFVIIIFKTFQNNLKSLNTNKMVDNTVAQGSGVGSIWNKGNWHWEEKNYTDFAKEFLTREWCSIVHRTAEAEIMIYEIKELKGSASVTIRKQKQLFMFEFEGEVYFKAKSIVPGDDRTNMQGKIKLFEFDHQDDEISTEVTAEQPGKWADNVRSALRREVTEKLHDITQKLLQAMKEKDIDEIRLAKA